MTKNRLQTFWDDVQKELQSDSSADPYSGAEEDITAIQRLRYDSFFQWQQLENNQPLGDAGLHKVLRESFPVELNGGDLVITYNGYRSEDIGRNRAVCNTRHLTYGVRLYLDLSLGPNNKVDYGLIDDFESRRYAIEDIRANIDVVPRLTNDCTFLIQSSSPEASPSERCPICNISLLDRTIEDRDKRYSLTNMRLYFVGDYLDREIRRALRQEKKRLDPWGRRERVIMPRNAAGRLCGVISRAIHGCLTDSRICPVLADTNPLALASQRERLNHVGPFGLSGKRSEVWRRHLHTSHFSRICPLETPESEAIGLTLHLARGTAVSPDGSLYARYVEGSRTTVEEEKSDIGSFWDRDKDDETVEVLNQHNATIDYISSNGIALWEKMPGQFLGKAAALIPFIQHDDPTRATMGAKNMKQAIQVDKGEAPLVRTGTESEIADEYRPGVNLLVGYLPWFGYNYEDGIVVSEHTAKRLKSYKRHKPITIVVKGNERPYLDMPTSSKKYTKLTEQGIVAQGINVQEGDIVAHIHELKPFGDDMVVAAKSREIRIPPYVRGKVKEAAYEAFHDEKQSLLSSGTIRGVIRIVIEEERQLEIGDKLMGRHGNKGVVSRILPDREMPYFPDNKTGAKDPEGSNDFHGATEAHTHLEMLLNPLGAISRMNLGQLVETHVGLVLWRGDVAAKQDFDKDWQPFEAVDFETLRNGLKSTELVNGSGKATLRYFDHCSQKTVAISNPVVIGKQYILKLDHMAADKMHARGSSDSRGRATITGQPVKGRKHGGGMRLGEMEVWALQAHGATHVLQELLTIKADQQKKDSPPRSTQALTYYLRGLGIDFTINDHGTLKVSLANDNTITAWSNGEVSASAMPKIKESTTKRGLRRFDLSTDKNGLFSPNIFGAQNVTRFFKKKNSSRKKDAADSLAMGHIQLATPIIHPIIYFTKIKSDINTKKIQGSVLSKMLHPSRPQKLSWSGNNREWRANISKQKQLLVVESTHQKIKIGELIMVSEYRELYRKIRAVDLTELCACPPSPAQYGLSVMEYELLRSLRGHMLTFLPVLPMTLRPYLHDSFNQTIELSDLNHLYIEVLRANQRLQTAIDNNLPHHRIHQFVEILEIAVNNLYFFGKKREDGRERRSIKHLLDGKTGLARKALLGKRCDYSARAVIVPAPELELDQIGIPKAIWDVLFPIKRQVNTKATEQERMVLATRAPSLHKYSVLAFRPVLNIDGCNSFRINPAICNPFNADFDGDQMSIFVLHRPNAISEARQKLTPQKNQVANSNGNLLTSMNLDIRLGIYHMKSDKSYQHELQEIFPGETPPADFTLYLRKTFLGDPEKGKQQAEALLRLAFKAATLSGCSFGIFDLHELVLSQDARSDCMSLLYKGNKLNINKATMEQYGTRIDALLGIDDQGSSGALREHSENPVSIIYTSGAKHDNKQIRQLIGMKGSMLYPLRGNSFPPIKGNYCEGLHPVEYFLATFQSRSTIMDKKLKTAPSGYFTRKMVSGLYETVIQEGRCTCDTYYKVTVTAGDAFMKHAWLLGRLLSPQGTAELKKISEDMLTDYLRKGATFSLLSPLHCAAPTNKICQYCYGRDLSSGDFPAPDLPVGIIAGQVIGERLTQVAMRSYHSGSADSLISDFGKITGWFDGSQDKLASTDDIPNILKKFKYQIDSIHFEVLLRAMHRNNQLSISRCAMTQESFLSAAAFSRFTECIASSAYEQTTCKAGLKDRIMLGKIFDA